MADDDDVIYVDIEARLNEGAAQKETDKLKEQVKKAGKVDIEPTLDEPAADRAAGKLKDRLKNAGDAIGEAVGDHLDKATDKASDKAADKFRKRLDGLQDTLGEALGKELGGLFGDGDGFGSHIGDVLKGQLGSVTDLFSGKGLELGNLPGMFDELRGGLREAAEGFKALIPEGSRAAGALGAVADAAGPLAAVLLGIGSVYSGLQDILHSPTRLDTSPGTLGLKPTLPQDVTQTPANLMPLPGGTQPVQLPPGIKPGTQYQATPGSLDPFAALLPPGMQPPAGATDPSKPATPIIPSNPLIPSIAPPDMPDHVGTRSSFAGGGIHATLVDFTTPSVSSPSDIPGAAGGVRNLYAVAESLAGTPYSQALRNDCSGMVSQIAAAALGLPAPSAGQRFSTTNEGAWLAGHGFQEGMGGPGDLNIGWYDHGGGNAGHTAATLPGGVNAESGGSAGAFTLGSGAAGASSPQFDHHMYLPMGGGGFGVRQAGFGTPGGGLLGPLPPPTQPNQGGGSKGQTPLGTGSGGGISGGGIIGAAEQAGVAAAGIAGFGGGAIAAQMAEQEINLAVQKGTQMGAALAAAPFETFGLSGGQMGAPSVNVMGGWPGKIISGLLGQQNQLPNIAAGGQPPKDPKQKDPNQPDQDPDAAKQNQGPSGSKDDPMHVNVTNQPQTPQGGVTSAANMTATMAPLTA